MFIHISIYAHFVIPVTVIINKNDKAAEVLFKVQVGILLLKFSEDAQLNKNASKHSILFKQMAATVGLPFREGAQLNKNASKDSILFKQMAPTVGLPIGEGAHALKIGENRVFILMRLLDAGLSPKL